VLSLIITPAVHFYLSHKETSAKRVEHHAPVLR
jgi:hypothetical protein